MNPLERLLDIEFRLNTGAISVDQACTEIFTGPKPWSTAWWKGQREARIASACATCGSAAPPLVLQHTWQPIRWKQALQEVGPPNWEWWKERNPLPNLNTPVEFLANMPVCPHCGSHRVRPRVRTKDWVCQIGQSGKPEERHADFAFPEPVVELRPDSMALRRHKEKIRLKYEELSRARWNAWLQSPEGVDQRLRALRLCIAESKRYLSLDDTKTLCRSCAASEDSAYLYRSERKVAIQEEAKLFRELDELE